MQIIFTILDSTLPIPIYLPIFGLTLSCVKAEAHTVYLLALNDLRVCQFSREV